MDTSLQNYKKLTEQLDWVMSAVGGSIILFMLGFTCIHEYPIILQSGVVGSLFALLVWYILGRKQKAAEVYLYELFKTYGYVTEHTTVTTVATKDELLQLALNNKYVELENVDPGYIDLPNRFKSAQQILLENPNLSKITRTNNTVQYPKLHQEYQDIIRYIAQKHINTIINYEPQR